MGQEMFCGIYMCVCCCEYLYDLDLHAATCTTGPIHARTWCRLLSYCLLCTRHFQICVKCIYFYVVCFFSRGVFLFTFCVFICMYTYFWLQYCYCVSSVSRIDQTIGLFCNRVYRRDYILQNKPIIWSILLTVATPTRTTAESATRVYLGWQFQLVCMFIWCIMCTQFWLTYCYAHDRAESAARVYLGRLHGNYGYLGQRCACRLHAQIQGASVWGIMCVCGGLAAYRDMASPHSTKYRAFWSHIS